MQPLARVTPATLDVLEVLLAAEETWGLQIVKATGRPAGSVYPILERLERLGWVHSSWDDDAERSGPRRRLYRLTGDGVAAADSMVRGRRVSATAVLRARGAVT